jgi:hypothetical protein
MSKKSTNDRCDVENEAMPKLTLFRSESFQMETIRLPLCLSTSLGNQSFMLADNVPGVDDT